MKIMKSALFLILASGLIACSQIDPIPRNQLVANIAPILKIEERADQIRQYAKMLDSLGRLNKKRSEEVKAHYDIYYVYYLVSNVQLAEGNTESYLAHIKLAEGELNAIETLLKDGFAKEGATSHRRRGSAPARDVPASRGRCCAALSRDPCGCRC